MHEGQKQFLNFFVARTLEDKQQEAEKILLASFEKQAIAPMTKADFIELQAQLMPLIKPEFTEEVKHSMEHFGSQLKD